MILGMSRHFEIYGLLHKSRLNWLKQESQLDILSWEFQWVNGSMGHPSHLLAFTDLFNNGRHWIYIWKLWGRMIFSRIYWLKMVVTLYWFLHLLSCFFLKLFLSIVAFPEIIRSHFTLLRFLLLQKEHLAVLDFSLDTFTFWFVSAQFGALANYLVK